MIVRLFFLFTIFVSMHASAAGNRPGVEGHRREIPNDYQWVGRIDQNGNIFCSAWILRHGVAVTARHCFSHQGISEADANSEIDSFALTFGTRQNRVEVSQLKNIHFDSGKNDIVFLLYDASLTQSIALNTKVVLTPEPANTPMNVVGFPGPAFHRTISENCRTTGFRGDFPAKLEDPGYEGLFDDTTCAAWFGVSGGVVFSLASDGTALLYGVVTHTFDVNADGSLDANIVGRDAFGEYSTTMFSPLRDSADLKSLMAFF